MAEFKQYVDFSMESVARFKNLLDAVDPQEPVTLAQFNAGIQGLAWKDNVQAASTANVTVSNPGTAVFDGVTLSNGERLLLKDQSSQPENGIYIFNGSGVALTRATDADTIAELKSAIVSVDAGTANGGTQWRQTTVSGTIGSANVVWTSFQASAPSASESTAGIAEIATQTETNTGTDDARIVTPLKLKNFTGFTRKLAFDVGDGSNTSYTLTHNGNTRDVLVMIRRNSGNYDFIGVVAYANNVNSVDILFAAAPSSAAYRAIVMW